MDRLRRVTMASAGALTTKPLTPAPATRALPSTAPPSMVIDLVMVRPPKPPGSSTEMMPPVAVLEMAPAKVLHGAVRLHGLASSPTPDTQVRVACACAAVAETRIRSTQDNRRIRIGFLLLGGGESLGRGGDNTTAVAQPVTSALLIR